MQHSDGRDPVRRELTPPAYLPAWALRRSRHPRPLKQPTSRSDHEASLSGLERYWLNRWGESQDGAEVTT